MLSGSVEVFATSWIEIGLKMWPMRTILVEVFATSWIEMSIGMEVPPRDAVEVFATSWIEIVTLAKTIVFPQRRGLCDLVD